MIKTFQALEAWLQSNGINPSAVRVVLSADFNTVSHISVAIRDEANKLIFREESKTPITEGHICGISFAVQSMVNE